MTMKKTLDGAVFVDLTVAKKTLDGSTFVDLTLAKKFDGVNWIDIPLPGGGGGGLSVTIAPGLATGTAITGPLFRVVTSNFVTATATGGTGPYTYSWTRVSGDSSVNANNPTAATTNFSATMGRFSDAQALMRCTVTDSLMATGFGDVPVTLFYEPLD